MINIYFLWKDNNKRIMPAAEVKVMVVVVVGVGFGRTECFVQIIFLVGFFTWLGLFINPQWYS